MTVTSLLQVETNRKPLKSRDTRPAFDLASTCAKSREADPPGLAPRYHSLYGKKLSSSAARFFQSRALSANLPGWTGTGLVAGTTV